MTANRSTDALDSPIGGKYEFHGYRVNPRRWDERITIEGYLYPDGLEAERLHQRACELAAEPDEYHDWGYDGQRVMRAWWD